MSLNTDTSQDFLRKSIFRESSFVCEKCGKTKKGEFLYTFLKHGTSNIQCLCEDCAGEIKSICQTH